MTDQREPLKRTFKFIVEVLKNAINLEWQTDAGRVNIIGMVLAFAVVMIAMIFNTAELIIGAVAAFIAREPMQSDANIIEVLIVFLGFTLLCVAMLGVLVLRSRHDDKRPDK